MSAIRVSLTGGNLRNDHVYLRGHLDFFPADVLGAPNTRDGQGLPVTLRFAGTGEESVTDIPGDKLIFRARAPWGRFFGHWRLGDGDEVVIAKAGMRSYSVRPAQKTARSRPALAEGEPVRIPEARDADRAHAGGMFGGSTKRW